MFSLITQSGSSYNLIFPGGACRERLKRDESLWTKCARKKTEDNELWWLLLHLLNPFHFFYSDLQWIPRSFCCKQPCTISYGTLTVTHFQFLCCSFTLLCAATIEPLSQNQDDISYIFNMGNGNDWSLCGVMGYGLRWQQCAELIVHRPWIYCSAASLLSSSKLTALCHRAS